MGTAWTSEDVALQFDFYDDILEQILGYRYVFRQFDDLRNTQAVILDYGCGPGKVALRYVTETGNRVLAVDVSENMLKIARKKRSHPLIYYRLVKNDHLSLSKTVRWMAQ